MKTSQHISATAPSANKNRQPWHEIQQNKQKIVGQRMKKQYPGVNNKCVQKK